jgi:hypothetical protein
MNGTPTEKGSKLEQLAKDIRTRKGLKPDVPTVDAFCNYSKRTTQHKAHNHIADPLSPLLPQTTSSKQFSAVSRAAACPFDQFMVPFLLILLCRAKGQRHLKPALCVS